LPAVLLLTVNALGGSWREDISLLVAQGEVRSAAETLEGIYAGLDSSDKPEASALLAFLSRMRNEPGLERRWLFEFFVTLGESSADLSFLGPARAGEAEAYLNGWRAKYPRLGAAWIITRKGESSSAPPASLVLGLEAPVEMLFKFSDERAALRGGLLHRGLNLLTVDAGRMFDVSGKHVFILDLKSGGVDVRQELALEVALNEEPAPSGAPGAMSLEYKVSLFAEGRRVASSIKTGRDKSPLALDIPQVNLRANPMFKPPAPSDDPFDPSNRGVSILDAVGVVTGLIKDLLKDKSRPYQSMIEKTRSASFVFASGSREGGERRLTAVVTLKTRGLTFRE
jgi:hypothetical protein